MKQFTLILILLMIAVPIYAASDSYTDESDFSSAISGFDEETTVDFETLTSGYEVVSGATIDGIQFNYTLPDNLIVTTDLEWSGSAGDNLLGVKGDNVFLSGDSVEFAFTRPMNAFGFHIIGSPDDIQPDDFQITTNTGSTYNISTPEKVLDDGGGAFFIGLVEKGAEPFSSVTFESLDENFEFHIDNIITARVLDIDGDGYENVNHNGNDCDDTDSDINPGKLEIPNNGKDDDCNALTADVVPGADGDLDGFSMNDGDCNDNDRSIYPGAVELCGDGIDQDCNGNDLTCPLPTPWYLDSDSDGYGNPVDTIQAVVQPVDYVADNTDCDDGNTTVHPGAIEVCGDGIDQDCNGNDLTCPLPTSWYLDSDSDGYGNPVDTIQAVVQPVDYVADNTDCDDGNTTVHPGAIEICGDGIDQDCSDSDLICLSNTVVIQTHGSGEAVILESPLGTVIDNSQAIANPSPPDTPPGVTFPYAFFSFSIDGVVPNGSTTMTITLPDGAKPDTYYKYGPTPDNTVNHWYEFMYDGETGAEINDNIITLTFVNGKRGDADLNSLNITIADPGGPAITDQAGLSGSSGGSSSKCFIGSVSY